MTYALAFLPRAEKELLEAYRWYEEQQSGLGKKFFDAAKDTFDKIEERPEDYSFGKRPFRQIKFSDFPYLVIFRIVKSQGTVVISSVFHTSRGTRNKFTGK